MRCICRSIGKSQKRSARNERIEKPRPVCTEMGVLSNLVTADWNLVGDGKELTIIGSHLSAKIYPAVIRGIEKGIIKTEGLISHCYKLADWKEAYETAEKRLQLPFLFALFYKYTIIKIYYSPKTYPTKEKWLRKSSSIIL